MKFMKKFFAVLLSVFAPISAFAQNAPNTSYITSLISSVGKIIGYIVPILIALAVAWLIWVVFSFIRESDAKKRGELRQQIIWAIVGLFVIVSVWGLVRLLGFTFGVQQGTTVTVPCPPGMVYDPARNICI